MATNQTEIVNDLVDNVKLLLSSDTNLESLKEIELCVKQNRIDLEKIELSKITGLEEQLALKVNIADIVDNLVSTITNNPLSANQGRVLNEKIKVTSEAIDSIKAVLASDDTTLDELQEIVNYIKQNKNDLSTLDLSNIAETSELKYFTKELKEKLEELPTNKNLETIIHNVGLPIGQPLLAYVQYDNTLVAFGGEFNRADYPKLWDLLSKNPGILASEENWQIRNTRDGMCGLFSSGDGNTTFRVPNLNEAFFRASNRSVGSFQLDEFKSHNHEYNTGTSLGSANANNSVSGTGVFYKTNRTTLAEGGSETRPKNIALLPLIVAK